MNAKKSRLLRKEAERTGRSTKQLKSEYKNTPRMYRDWLSYARARYFAVNK